MSLELDQHEMVAPNVHHKTFQMKQEVVDFLMHHLFLIHGRGYKASLTRMEEKSVGGVRGNPCKLCKIWATQSVPKAMHLSLINNEVVVGGSLCAWGLAHIMDVR